MLTKKIVGVFAHPDDEISIAGLLIRAQEMGIETHIIYASSEKVLTKPEFNIKNEEYNSENLSSINGNFEKFGIYFVHFLDILKENKVLVDGNNSEKKLLNLLKKINPDYIITFDSKNVNINSNHRSICELTINAYKKINNFKDKKLYHITLFPRNLIEKYTDDLKYPKILKTRIVDNLSTPDNQGTLLIHLTNDELLIKLEAAESHMNKFKDEKVFCYGLPYSIYKKMILFECFSVNELCDNSLSDNLLFEMA